MDIKILHSHLLEYLKTEAKPHEIGRCLALCGPSVERVYKYNKKDWIYEIEITTNRVDSMSVMGIAREAAAILPKFNHSASFTPKQLTLPKEPTGKSPAIINIKADSQLTNRIMGVIMEVEIGESPQYIKDRLTAADIRTKNNLIDITNYIMTEIGHPTHVFDYDRIASKTMIIRSSKKGEQVTSLENKTYTLPGGDIVIEDGNGTIIDLPGIIGTANSVVTPKTKRILFFIDNNDPVRMRKTSMTLGIRTVAVTLNEKKVDPELAESALSRGIQLYQQIANGRVISKIYDIYDNKPQAKHIRVSHDFIQNRIGVNLKPKFITSTLNTLGFKVKQSRGEYQLTIPSYRANDIDIPEDIVEEIARIYGYHNMPSIIPQQQRPKTSPQKNHFYWEKEIKNALKYLGYTENYTYSLISQELINNTFQPLDNHLQLKNPLSTEWEYLRLSLIPSLIQSLSQNQDKQDLIQFFELANVYLKQPKDIPHQPARLSLIKQNTDFFNLKGIIQTIFNILNLKAKWSLPPKKNLDSDLLPNKSIFDQSEHARIKVYDPRNKKWHPAGYIGKINHDICHTYSIPHTTYAAELDFDLLPSIATKTKRYQPISKHPPIIEHLTFFNATNKPANQVIKTALKTDKLVTNAIIIDFYKDKLTLEITYHSNQQNLSDTKVTPIRRAIVKNIHKLGLKLQGEV